MTTEATTSQEERADLKKRADLQTKLQEAIRRSAPSSELRRIQQEIETLNRKLESYQFRSKRPTGT
jgi:hypothetical protein